MLTMVEARTPQGVLLSLPMSDISGGYLIEEIDGLDPVKATLVSSSFAKQDGSQYHSSRREDRNIKLRVKLEPNYMSTTVRGLRTHLYTFFMPKSAVSLRFYDSDGLVVNISGRVESFGTPLFAKESVVDISIVCFDPDFVELDPVIFSGMTTPGFDEVTIAYAGSVETGIQFVLQPDRVINAFTIYHLPPNDSLRQMDFAAPLAAGDVLTISTIPGNKFAQLNKTGFISSILYGISPESNWIELMHGDNQIRVYAEGAAIPYTIEYVNRHGGL